MAQETESTQSNQDILNAASQAIARGDMALAQDIVSPLITKKGLSTQQKLKLSHELQWLGLPVQAMKALGKIAAPADFHLLAPEEFCLQIRAVYMLNFLGATYVARRLLERIEDYLVTRKIDLSGFHFSLDTYKAFILYESARYHDALPLFERIVANAKEYSTKAYLALHLISCLEAVDREGDAKELALQYFREIPDDNSTLRAMYLQNMGRMELLHGDKSLALNYLEQSSNIFGGQHKNKDEAYAILWQGIAKGLSTQKQECHHLLKVAWDLLHHPLSQPQAQLTVLYWMELLDSPLDLSGQIAIRSHSCINSFPYLLGKPIHENIPYPLHARILREAKANSKHDAWLIDNDKIVPVSYADLNLNTYDKLLDLYSGVDKEGPIRETFTEIQVRALIAALGSGPIGIHEYALVDFIYRQDFWDWQSGKERLKKLIQYLRKKGMPLTVRNQIHRLNLDDLDKKQIIIPMALDFQGHHHFVRGHAKRFTRLELEELLGTKKTNASLLLKEWGEKGIIAEESKSGAKIYYTFMNAE